MKRLKFVAVFLPLVTLIGCQKAETPNAVNTANTSNATPATTQTPGPPPIADNIADSPSDVYRMAHVARQKKDIETLKKIFSKDILDFFTEIGKTEKKSLDDELREMCKDAIPGEPEVRNEKINGDKASVEYKEDGTWKKMDFVKEDGAWKMTIPKGDPDKDKEDKDNK